MKEVATDLLPEVGADRVNTIAVWDWSRREAAINRDMILRRGDPRRDADCQKRDDKLAGTMEPRGYVDIRVVQNRSVTLARENSFGTRPGRLSMCSSPRPPG